jgi:predicted dehydrogenase
MGEIGTDTSGARAIGVGVIGFGWMGRVHAQAYARVRHHFPDLELLPQLVAVADEVPGRAEGAAAQFGFATAVRDWRALLADPRVHAVSVTAPNWLHREIGVAVAEAGRHLWIEKPVGLTADDARAVADAARTAGVRSGWASTTAMRPASHWPARWWHPVRSATSRTPGSTS